MFCKRVPPHFWSTRSLSVEGNGTSSRGASSYNDGGRLGFILAQHSCLCPVHPTYAVTSSSSGHPSLSPCTTLVTQGPSHSRPLSCSCFLLPPSAKNPTSPQMREAIPWESEIALPEKASYMKKNAAPSSQTVGFRGALMVSALARIKVLSNACQLCMLATKDFKP